MSKKILFIFAHPDDESFACAGTIAKYHDMGHNISLICATSGCKGKSGEYQFSCREHLARHREKEMKCAAEIIGISNLYLYRYPDGGLNSADMNQLTEEILQTMLEIKPDIIVTFPPDGVTGHPDHIAISYATKKAISRMESFGGYHGDLYFVSIPHYYDYCDKAELIDPFPITGKVDITPYRTLKGRALQAHRSQIYSLNRAYPGVLYGDHRAIGNYEYYTKILSKGKPISFFKSQNTINAIELIEG